MSEVEDAYKVAEEFRNKCNADPDGDVAVLCRQLLQQREQIKCLEESLELCMSGLDCVRAIVDRYRDADSNSYLAIRAPDCKYLHLILRGVERSVTRDKR